MKESNTRIGSLLAKSKNKSYAELSKLLVDDADNFFKQRFASFNNRDFKFDLKGKHCLETLTHRLIDKYDKVK